MTTISATDQHLAHNFDDPEVVASIMGIVQGWGGVVPGRLNDEQCVRLEACTQFFQNLPPKRRGRTTSLSLKDIQAHVMRLTTQYPTLRGNDPETLTQKIEIANETLRLRFNQ
jgi:hypothetical protein